MFDKISLFIEVAKCESISQAAENLYLSQSTASTKLRSLESDLHVSLFDRTNRRIILNKNGRVFLNFAQETMTSYAKTMQTINNNQQLSRSTLSFCAGIYFNIYFLPDLLRRFIKQFGNMNIQITSPSTEEIIASIRHKKYDFGIINAAKDIDHSGFVIDFIYEHPLYFICSPKNSLAGRKNILTEDIHNQTFIFNKKSSNYQAYVSSCLKDMNIKPKMQITIETMEATKKAVINNLGISILPDYIVKKELKDGELNHIHIKDSIPLTRRICCIHNAKRQMSQTSLKFIRTCSEYFHELEASYNDK
ncbi:MAG: LysR family transcriptional regulator [Candidatus Thermoplasmatota archaeon]|nr:LysR family transcriptional regulator [Candidatus Thermoplasmatota archaeon]